MLENTLIHTARGARQGVRIDLPVNLEAWRDRPDTQVEILTWFHQHLLDNEMTWSQASAALGYDSDDQEGAVTLLEVLRGAYSGDWSAFLRRVADYRKVAEERIGIQHAEFRETPVTKMIWSGLDYALAAGCITIIEGESGHGKTISQEVWRAQRAKGRAVAVEAPAMGGTGLFVEELGKAVGYQRKYSASRTREAIFNAFSSERILLVDEATRLLPRGAGMPEKLEFLRELHDKKHMPLALFATRRFYTELENSYYIFEQVLGRCMFIRLPALLDEACWRPVVVQYFPKPSEALLKAADNLANNKLPRQKGRVRLLAEVLKLASRIASKAKQRLTEEHFFRALALRQQMMGAAGLEG